MRINQIVSKTSWKLRYIFHCETWFTLLTNKIRRRCRYNRISYITGAICDFLCAIETSFVSKHIIIDRITDLRIFQLIPSITLTANIILLSTHNIRCAVCHVMFIVIQTTIKNSWVYRHRPKSKAIQAFCAFVNIVWEWVSLAVSIVLDLIVKTSVNTHSIDRNTVNVDIWWVGKALAALITACCWGVNRTVPDLSWR